MNIVVVDDDEDDKMVFTSALDSLDIPVEYETAKDGADALELINNNLLFFPDYIFLDLNMPGMTGFQFLEEIKKVSVLRTIPVIIYTTSNYEKDINRSFELGAYGFIRKPHRFEDLQNILKRILSNNNLSLSKERLVFT
ncbi:response regulator [Chryseosolibacter indicus]|uniref:Response regulator n=1 Tax=Chryseosolibacter indicus TaxID=2782351 RepID=A0ABS5VUK2_9BACT|nr:response regulator [Chryseosolibacter indicus]MBT1704510.1 response regulator [Chryseosolibacter indicus]